MILKAAYTVPELAEMSGMPAYSVRRILKRAGVRMIGSDTPGERRRYVPLSELKARCPLVWESLIAVDSDR